MMFDLFTPYPIIISLISILLNIIIAIAGILPSTFVTLGTVSALNLNLAIIILIIGEAAGAIISFTLYRKGLQKLSAFPRFNKLENRYLSKLKESDGAQAFFIVIFLRVLPFVPSGIVTLTAAISKLKVLPFSIASTAGKIPAIMIEAYSIVYFLTLGIEWQILIGVIILLIYLIYLTFKKSFRKSC